ncbi:MAG: hypothetical protein EBU23_17860, partial [Mycobacteriaceae bacterium]|nr:hypothetical protein [Mycobacteriaceae bacterium]
GEDGEPDTGEDGESDTGEDGESDTDERGPSLRLDAARLDRAAEKRFPSAGELCDTIRLHILELEERARAAPSGMAQGVRWVYLFADRAPNVASKA